MSALATEAALTRATGVQPKAFKPEPKRVTLSAKNMTAKEIFDALKVILQREFAPDRPLAEVQRLSGWLVERDIELARTISGLAEASGLTSDPTVSATVEVASHQPAGQHSHAPDPPRSTA